MLPPQQAYVQNLTSLGFGFPLFSPSNVQLGDVGFMNQNNGSFQFLYNVAAPDTNIKGHPPPLTLHYTKPDLTEWQAIHMSAKLKRKIDVPIQPPTAEGNARFQFSNIGRGDVFLIPGNTVRKDTLREQADLKKYFETHLSWITQTYCIRENIGWREVILVVGTTKTNQWAIAVNINEESKASLAFVIGGSGVNPRGEWSGTVGFEKCSRHEGTPYDEPTETIFIDCLQPRGILSRIELSNEPGFMRRLINKGTAVLSRDRTKGSAREVVKTLPDTKKEMYDHQKLRTKSFHSTVLPNLNVSVDCALTTFETAISPWMRPAEWLDANTKHMCAIFDGIVKCSENEAVKLPETKVFQRLIVYIYAYNMVCLSDNTLLDQLNVILKKCRERDILNLIRSQGNIKNELWTLFQKASPDHREMKYDDLFKRLLILDSISLSANIEVLIADEDTYEDVVETTGPGAQSLVNILQSRLDFPMRPKHKRLLVGALARLSESSGVYPDSLILTNVTPERGRRAVGGFADVYKGRCLGEDIALKVLKVPLPCGVNSLNSWRLSEDRCQNLIQEVFTWRQLSHPNVLPFYGIHFLEDLLEIRFCLVSPWMEHGNIVEFLVRRHRDGPYTDTTDCISLALDIANGLKYLHGERVIHRDLKGYNILISPSLRAYITDFGLATFTDSGSATTLAGSAIMGTSKWLAPELIPHEEAKRYHSYASDIYAFALVCYEMFSGKVPFKDVQIDRLKLLLQKGDRPSLPADDLSRRRGLSSEMEGVIRDCWAQEPTKRPSADKVVERLQLLSKHQDDHRPLDKIGASFFAQLLRAQADNPFAILSKEYHRE